MLESLLAPEHRAWAIWPMVEGLDSTRFYETIELLGHRDVRTTMVYTHVPNRDGLGVVSPIDAVRGSEVARGICLPRLGREAVRPNAHGSAPREAEDRREGRAFVNRRLRWSDAVRLRRSQRERDWAGLSTVRSTTKGWAWAG